MKKLILACAVCVLLSACAHPPSSTGYALFQRTTNAESVAEGRITKTGTACSENFLGIVAVGDSSITAAKRDGGIRNAVVVDYTIDHIFLYGKRCTIVKGN